MDLEALTLHYYLKIFSLIIIALIIFFNIFFFYKINEENYFSTKIIEIKKGDNIDIVLDNFFPKKHFSEIIIYKIFFKIYSNIYSLKIHYGEFNIEKSKNFYNFIKKITKPSNVLNKITIIEGWSKIELDKELSKYFESFESIAFNQILADTYYFNKNDSFINFLNKLKKFKDEYLKRYDNHKLLKKYTFEEIFIIGSLLEKEGFDYEDKRLISSVIFNRLDKNMKLQIDATVIYALTDGKYDKFSKVTLKDLKYKHPYNTYIIKNLPPSPISYVGTKTIDIILENYKSNFLFYFYNEKLKKHIFSENFEEHKRKLNEYRK